MIFCLHYDFIVASVNFARQTLVQMHSAAETVFPFFARRAFSGFHPFAVTHVLESVVPDVHEFFFVDVSLNECRRSYAQACSYVSVAPDRSDADSSAAKEKPISDFQFVISKVAFA